MKHSTTEGTPGQDLAFAIMFFLGPCWYRASTGVTLSSAGYAGLVVYYVLLEMLCVVTIMRGAARAGLFAFFLLFLAALPWVVVPDEQHVRVFVVEFGISSVGYGCLYAVLERRRRHVAALR